MWWDEGGDAGGGFGAPPPQNTGYPVDWVPLSAQQIGMAGGSPYTLNASNYGQALDYIGNHQSWEDLNSQKYSSDAGGGFGSDKIGAGLYRNYYVPEIGQVTYDPGKNSLLQFNGQQTNTRTDGIDDGWHYQEWTPGGQKTDNLTHTETGWIDQYIPAITMAGIAAIGGAAFGGAMGAGSGAAAEGAGAASLPSGGMAATGTAAPWAASTPALGSGMYGTGVADMGALMGTSGGAFELGTGLSGITAADLAASTGGVDWLSHAQKLAKLLSNGNSVAPSAQGGSGGTVGGTVGGTTSPAGSNFFSQSQPQAIDLMPKFSAAPVQQGDYTALGNSQNINRLAQALRDYKGSVYG